MLNVFAYQDYRKTLKALADQKKESSFGAFKYAQLASAMGIQATYLSRTFRHEAHLNSDQLDLACEALSLTEEENEYLQLLMEAEKTGFARRREKLLSKLKKLQEKARDTKTHLAAPTVSPDQQSLYQGYFLEPFAPLVHVFLSLPQYQKNPEDICKHLKLSSKKLRKILKTMEQLEILSFDAKKAKYNLLKDHLHLEKSSALNLPYQSFMRTLSAEHALHLDSDQRHQYAVTFGADESTFKMIYDEFNKFIRRVEQHVRSNEAAGVFQLNFDLFRWDAQEMQKSQAHRIPEARPTRLHETSENL